MDPRLLRYAGDARRYLILTCILTCASGAATTLLAFSVASALSSLITDPESRNLAAQTRTIGAGVGAVIASVLIGYGQARFAHRAGSRSIAQLRRRVIAALRPPHGRIDRDLAAGVLGDGLDALAPYLAGFVPAFVATTTLTPAFIIVIGFADLTSAIICVITVPLIPIFMVLIGKMTAERTRNRLLAMANQHARVVDLITGLPTLRALGRAPGAASQIDSAGERYERTTMSSLRIAFLSGLVLELLATLCVALVAVGIGLRLVTGDITLFAGVFALILAPEVYAPLRAVGAQFHNSRDGLTAAREAFTIIEAAAASTPDPSPAGVELSGVKQSGVKLSGVSVFGRDGNAPDRLSLDGRPGQITLLLGPNGSGKSTALAVALGVQTASGGETRSAAINWSRTAWLPTKSYFEVGTVGDNLDLLGALEPKRLAHALTVTGAEAVIGDLDGQRSHRIGVDGTGLSLGQRQRIALARVLARDAHILLLDEPTAHLDADSEQQVLAELRRRADAGDTVVIASHRPATRAIADDVVQVRASTAAQLSAADR